MAVLAHLGQGAPEFASQRQGPDRPVRQMANQGPSREEQPADQARMGPRVDLGIGELRRQPLEEGNAQD